MSSQPHTGVRWRYAGVVGAVFALVIALPLTFKSSGWYRSNAVEWSIDLRYLVQPSIQVLVVLCGLLLLRMMRARDERPIAPPTMGLLIGWRRVLVGVFFGAACSLPMLGLGFLSPREEDLRYLAHQTVLAGFTEELVYRAFAFGMLVQLGRVRVWPAAIATGLIFGAVHLVHGWVRGMDALDQLGWLGMIALGGVLYAWLYWRWRYNLWVIISIHTMMNLWWGVFDLNANSLGSWASTASRVLAVALAISLTELSARGVLLKGLVGGPRRSDGQG